jgi:hypothetical protein
VRYKNSFRVSSAPLPHSLYVCRIAEVISIVRFVQPPPLAGGFARVPTIHCPAIELSIGVVNIRTEKSFATAALASARLELHKRQTGRKIRPPINQENRR